jgi:hypothetical protein
MPPLYCIMFTASLTDDMRDLLFREAYLMLQGFKQRKKVKSSFCEGVITTTSPPLLFLV